MSSPLPIEEGRDEGHAPDPDDVDAIEGGAVVAFRRIVGEMPELRHGAGLTALLALAIAAGRVTVPVLLQQVLDRGILGPEGYRPAFIAVAVAVAVVAIVVFWTLERIGLARLTRAAESGLAGVRVRTFEHIHRLSAADHTESRRGVLVSRVTSDVETLAQFWSWGAMVWLSATATILGVGTVMAVYSWRLTLLTFAVFVPVTVLLRQLQKVQLRRWDAVRDRVGDTLGEFSEAIGGAPVIRAYGLGDRGRRRLRHAVQRQYRAELGAARVFAIMFPLSDIFGAIAVAAVAAVGVWQGPAWGLDAGELVAFALLVTLLTQPIADLGEVLDQTQNAAAGARKVLGTLDIPLDVVEPCPGVALPDGPLGVRVSGVDFAYRATAGGNGPRVLEDVSVEVGAGSSVAVVGQTGSGKTTFASLLARLADPVAGTIEVGGQDLRTVASTSRLQRIRMVPQDGFLFATTVRENIRFGRLDATDAAIDAAIDDLGLGWWVARLPRGLDTEAGERGDNLSVGERQLVALVRAQVSDPGLLILDEATSAVDPETERALAGALTRLAAGRTTVTVAHRLSTAERADRVLVFDAGRLVEEGTHDELVTLGGVYAGLHHSWVGGTRTTA
jgi:putative ABC transport system ATP-binding protein